MNPIRSSFLLICLVVSSLALPGKLAAWGPDGHRVVGWLAVAQMNPASRDALQRILGTGDPVRAAEACNWPDAYRATAEGAWSGPLHYINVPAEAGNYRRERDCRGGACSAEAIKRYAADLGDASAPAPRRREAWAWVCHLAGDIHQPMHSGYAHDRGGNDSEVEFRGQALNLHAFWDRALVESNYSDWTELAADLVPLLPPVADHAWEPANADQWVRDSHVLLRKFGYPRDPQISRAFAASSWLLARRQMALAATRLAALVNSALASSGP